MDSLHRILLIDDDDVDRQATRRALSKTAFRGELIEARNIPEALPLIHSQSFDCILLDYQLPGMDGLSFLGDLRNEVDAVPPVVMLTGEGNERVAVEAMKNGALDYLTKAEMSPETLSRAIYHAVRRNHLQNRLDEAHERLKHQAFFDDLTGLGNRNLFARDLSKTLSGALRGRRSFAIFMMDLDRFKKVNDTFGHEAGDTVLEEFGRRLKEISREGEDFYRIGGDEFSGLIDASDAEEIIPIVRRIKNAAEIPFLFDTHSLRIGISIGIAFHPAHGDLAEDLLRVADTAMYRSKRSGSEVEFGP